MSGYSVGGNDESGYHVTDPNGHVIDVGDRSIAENYAREQNQPLQQRGISSAYDPSESFGDTLKSCAAMIVGIVVAVVVIALIANFIIVHIVFH